MAVDHTQPDRVSATTPDAGGTLPVLGLPYAFSQVHLLTSGKFIREAKSWGHDLSLDTLQELNESGLLVPFYRVDDAASDDFVVETPERDLTRPAQYARAGQVRDPALEDASINWPYRQPPDVEDRWWDGFYYSAWQLLGVSGALNSRKWLQLRPSDADRWREQEAKHRREHLAIAALSARYIPSIVGRIRFDSAEDQAGVRDAQCEIVAFHRLQAAGYPIESLRDTAEFMLLHAGSIDPVSEWWDLIRHSNHEGWFRLGGAALEAVWWRLGAEVLLRAHEELAEAGELEALPDLAGSRFHHALMDRPGPPQDGPGLERSLARLGLSPHPRVILVVEGETELHYIGTLLTEIGLSRRHLVRLIAQGTSSDWPRQLATYIAPRLGGSIGRRRVLDSMPTALVVAMDAEGDWETPRQRSRNLARMQRIVRDQVVAQGSTLTPDELDTLVKVRTWGEFTFELANFADDELEVGLREVARRHKLADPDDPNVSANLRSAIVHVRQHKLDVKVVFDRMQWAVHKMTLAEELAPVLVAKLDHDQSDPDHVHSPAIQLVFDVHGLVQRLSGGGFSLETEDPPSEDPPSAEPDGSSAAS